MDVTRSTGLTQLGGQFVLKVATVFTNTRLQSNTLLLDGIVNDSLWEMVPLFDQSFFQRFHVVNPALVDALLEHTPNLIVNRV